MGNIKEQKESNGEFYLEKKLLAPYTHIMQFKGKQQRKKIPIAFNEWFKIPAEKAEFIVDTVHMLHNGTLLFDDIQDNTVVRKGLPAAHCVYGVPLAINAGIHVVTLVLTKLHKLNHPEVSRLYCEDFLEIIRGQGAELYWRDNFQCPTNEEYEYMMQQKCGNMFRLAVRLMQLFSDYKTDLGDLAAKMGLYFNLRDDYYNLVKEEEVEEWPVDAKEVKKQEIQYADDITEGKFTSPLIHAINQPEGVAVLNILRQHTTDYNLKKYCVSELERLGSLQFTRDRLKYYEKYLRDEVNRLGGNPKLIAALDEMTCK